MANPIPLVQTPFAGASALNGIPVNIAGIDTGDKPEIAALTPLASNADLPTAVTKINAVIAALKA